MPLFLIYIKEIILKNEENKKKSYENLYSP